MVAGYSGQKMKPKLDGKYCPIAKAFVPDGGYIVKCKPNCAWRIGAECAVVTLAKKRQDFVK